MIPALAFTILTAAMSGAPASTSQERKLDRVTPRKGPPAEGTIVRDTWKEVVLRLSSGSETTFRVEDVLSVEYADAPDAMKAGLADFEAGNWEEALTKITSAEEAVQGKGLDSATAKKITVRSWFGPWVTFHRGYCLKELHRIEDALRELLRYVDGALKEPNRDSRFLARACEAVMECYRGKADEPGMAAFLERVKAAPREVQGKIQQIASVQQGEMLLSSGKVAEAQAIFQRLAESPDVDIRTSGTLGVIRCHQKSDQPDALVRYCENVIKTTPLDQPGLLLLASLALGEAYGNRKEYRKAVGALVDAIVKYHPGRGTELVREHERALYTLAKTYEAWSAESTGDLKTTARIWAARTWRELSMEYPNGRYRDEANAGIARCEAPEEKKP
ncbi:MAG: hypothetical protein HY716_03135 [Planctomycetes bacterium]|nr:hypothetical protein [Planctomycetota bacterium]